jgi:uncharacterized membrane protein
MSKKAKASRFFDKAQKEQIRRSIQEAERMTSGEIRVHIENRCEIELMDRVKEVFYLLQIHETDHKNGVLIYVALQDKKVAIVGDEGIDELTPEDFWDKEVEVLVDYFTKKDFTNGLAEVIRRIGEKLKTHFPYQSNDINELSDEISFYDN